VGVAEDGLEGLCTGAVGEDGACRRDRALAQGVNTTPPPPVLTILSPTPGPIPPGPDGSPHQLFVALIVVGPALFSPLPVLEKNAFEATTGAPPLSIRPSPPL